MIRKNITIPEDQYDIIERFARNKGESFSEFLRNAAMKEISRTEDMELAEFLRTNVDYVSSAEQQCDSLNMDDFRSDDFEDLSLDDIL